MMDGMTAKQNAAMPGAATRPPSLDTAIARSVESLLSLQHEDGHWVFELEADATIPAEYILLQHYLGTIDLELEQRTISARSPPNSMNASHAICAPPRASMAGGHYSSAAIST